MTVRINLQDETKGKRKSVCMSVGNAVNRLYEFFEDVDCLMFENEKGELVDLEAGALAFALCEKKEEIEIEGGWLGMIVKIERV